MHSEQLTTLVSQVVHCCTYVKHDAVPLLQLDALPYPLPPCSVHDKDENISVVTQHPNCFCPIRCSLQHVAAQRDIHLLMGDATIEVADKLHVVIKRIYTEDLLEDALVV